MARPLKSFLNVNLSAGLIVQIEKDRIDLTARDQADQKGQAEIDQTDQIDPVDLVRVDPIDPIEKDLTGPIERDRKTGLADLDRKDFQKDQNDLIETEQTDPADLDQKDHLIGLSQPVDLTEKDQIEARHLAGVLVKADPPQAIVLTMQKRKRNMALVRKPVPGRNPAGKN